MWMWDVLFSWCHLTFYYDNCASTWNTYSMAARNNIKTISEVFIIEANPYLFSFSVYT